MKCMQVNGILIDKEVKLIVTHDGKEYLFIFMPYSIFKRYNMYLINPEEIEECNTGVVYTSMGNNSIEVYYIKTLISLFYFAYRIEVEEKRKELYFASEREYLFQSSEDILEKYKERESPVIKNWNIRGFWNENYIEDIHWCVKLGRNEMSCDDFESYLSRCYGGDLCDSYDRRYIFKVDVQRISISQKFLENMNILITMIQTGGTLGNKLKSAMRLYYEIFMIYTNMNLSIITLATIMETLLLGKDEDNQRKKVSVRSACIICDEMKANWKKTIAEAVYCFYHYRNAIVHDGKSYLDFEEVQLNNMVENMKHIVFEIVHYYFDKQLENIGDIKQLVTKNQNLDGLTNAFDYIPPDAGTKFYILLPE